MAGLNELISDKGIKTTAMPAWYDAAQQQAVTGATNAFSTAPSLQNTVAGQAINTLSQPNNPFQQAQTTLGQISSGAANPWIVNPTTNQITPNVNTPLGGLFEAQNQQLRQILPQIGAQAMAGGTGSGQFGSLRATTARDKAIADAQANMLTSQMQAALQNQQTGSQAAANLGNVANQGITAASNLGQLQQSDPYANAAALTKILGALNVGNTTTSQTQYSPLSQITTAGAAMQGGLNALNATKAGSDLLKSLKLTGLLPGGGSAANPDGSTPYDGWESAINPDYANAPEGAYNSEGLLNPGYYQDELGYWTTPDVGGSFVDSFPSGDDTFGDWWG